MTVLAVTRGCPTAFVAGEIGAAEVDEHHVGTVRSQQRLDQIDHAFVLVGVVAGVDEQPVQRGVRLDQAVHLAPVARARGRAPPCAGDTQHGRHVGGDGRHRVVDEPVPGRVDATQHRCVHRPRPGRVDRAGREAAATLANQTAQVRHAVGADVPRGDAVERHEQDGWDAHESSGRSVGRSQRRTSALLPRVTSRRAIGSGRTTTRAASGDALLTPGDEGVRPDGLGSLTPAWPVPGAASSLLRRERRAHVGGISGPTAGSGAIGGTDPTAGRPTTGGTGRASTTSTTSRAGTAR